MKEGREGGEDRKEGGRKELQEQQQQNNKWEAEKGIVYREDKGFISRIFIMWTRRVYSLQCSKTLLIDAGA